MSVKMDRTKMLTFKVTQGEMERYRRLAVRHSPGAPVSEVIRIILDQACAALGIPLAEQRQESPVVDYRPLFDLGAGESLSEALAKSRRFVADHSPQTNQAPAPPRRPCVRCLVEDGELTPLGFCRDCQRELSAPATPLESESLANGADLGAQVIAELPELPPAEPPTPTLDRIVDHATGRGESASPAARKMAKINRQRADKPTKPASNAQKQPVARAKGKPAAGKPAAKPKGQKTAQKGRK